MQTLKAQRHQRVLQSGSKRPPSEDRGRERKRPKSLFGQKNKFSWKSTQERLKQTKIDTQRVDEVSSRLGADDREDLGSSDSLFHQSIANARSMNITIPFKLWVRTLEPMARSLPLVLHHQKDIVAQFLSFFNESSAHDLGLAADAAAYLIVPFASDLDNLFLPYLPSLFQTLVYHVPQVIHNPTVTSSLFNVAGALIRKFASRVIDTEGLFAQLWTISKSAFDCPKILRATDHLLASTLSYILRRSSVSKSMRSILGLIVSDLPKNPAAFPKILAAAIFVEQGIHSKVFQFLSECLALERSQYISAALSDVILQILTSTFVDRDATDLVEPGSFSFREQTAFFIIKSVRQYETELPHVASFVTVMANGRKGNLVNKKTKEILVSLLRDLSAESIMREPDAAASLLALVSQDLWVKHTYLHDFVKSVFRTPQWPLLVLIVDKLEWEIFSVLIPHIEMALERSPNIAVLTQLAGSGRLKSRSEVYSKVLESSSLPAAQKLVLLSCLVDVLPQKYIEEQVSTVGLSEIHRLASASLSKASLEQEFAQSPVNSALVLTVIVKLLTLCDKSLSDAVSDSLLNVALSHGHWHPPLMEALGIWITHTHRNLEATSDALQECLLAENSLIRTRALETVLAMQASKGMSPSHIDLCLSIENASADMQGAQVKVALLKKLASRSSCDDPSVRVYVQAYLLSQLKVNLALVWPEAVAALSSPVWSESLFDIFKHELDLVEKHDASVCRIPKVSWTDEHAAPAPSGSIPGEPWCKSLDEHADLVAHCTSVAFESPMSHALVVAKGIQQLDPHEKLDVVNYEVQLASVASQLDLTVEHRDAIAKYVPLVVGAVVDVVDFDNPWSLAEAPHVALPFSASDKRRILHSWLGFLKAQPQGQRAPFADPLNSLLAFSDRSLQTSALETLLTWKVDKRLTSGNAGQHLLSMLNNASFRDELLAISSDERLLTALSPFFVKLAYGLMVSSEGKRSAQGRKPRRAALLSAVAQVPLSDIKLIIALSMHSFRWIVDPVRDWDPEDPLPHIDRTLSGSDAGKILGFLDLLSYYIKHLGMRFDEDTWRLVMSFLLALSSIVQRQVDLFGPSSSHVEAASAEELRIELQQQQSHQQEDESDLSDDEGAPPFESEPSAEQNGKGPENIHNESEDESDDDDEEPDDDSDNAPDAATLASLQKIRQQSIRRFSEILTHINVPQSASDYLDAAVQSMVLPRMDRNQFASENAQSPSALLHMLLVFAQNTGYVKYLGQSNIMSSVFDILVVRNVKDTAVLVVLDIIQTLLDYDDVTVEDELVRPNAEHLLQNLNVSLLLTLQSKSDKSQRIFAVESLLVARLSRYAKERDTAESYLKLVVTVLDSSKRLSPRTLASVLKIVPEMVAHFALPEALIGEARKRVVDLMISQKDTDVRDCLVKAYSSLGSKTDTAILVQDLNSWARLRLEVEPDFEKRLAAFEKIQTGNFDAEEWRVFLANALFFIQDTEELSIRTSAAGVIKRFFVLDVSGDLVDFVLGRLLGLINVKAEVVKTEVVLLIGFAVEHAEKLPGALSKRLISLRHLLMDGDPEADFFQNVLHVQSHRRVRALGRLGMAVPEDRDLNGRLFIPLLHHFILSSVTPSTTSGNTKVTRERLVETRNAAVRALSVISGHLTWPMYRTLVLRYASLGQITTETSLNDNKDDLKAFGAQKVYIRALTAIVKNVASPEYAKHPSYVRFVHTHALTRLLGFLERRVDVDGELRAMVTPAITAAVLSLPEKDQAAEARRLFMSLCQLLKSRTRSIREAVRAEYVASTLALGWWSVPLSVNELRQRLTTGPQVHVQAFTVHSVIVKAVARIDEAKAAEHDSGQPDDEDVITERLLRLHGPPSDEIALETISEASPIFVKDSFGLPDRERNASEFASQTPYNEVRQLKSIDGFELLARMCPPSLEAADVLLQPLHTELRTTNLTVQLGQRANEVIHRVANGMTKRSRWDTLTLLTMAEHILNGNANFLRAMPEKYKKAKNDVTASSAPAPERIRVEINAKPQNRASTKEGMSEESAADFFSALGYQLLGIVFKGRLDIHDESQMAIVDRVIPSIGEGLFAATPNVLMQALRAVGPLMRLPLDNDTLNKASAAMARRVLQIILDSGTPNSGIAQMAMQTMASLVRESKQETLLRDHDFTRLMEVIRIYLPEATANFTSGSGEVSIMFQLLRSILSKQWVAAEIYDVMETVATMLVTSASAHLREVSRALYLQFVLDYPHGKGRLAKVFTFLAQNLSYTYESGRLSVLELLRAIVTKLGFDAYEAQATMLFMSLVVLVANDDSPEVREKGSGVIKELVRVASSDKVAQWNGMLSKWMGDWRDNPTLAQVSLQISAATSLEVPMDSVLEIMTETHEGEMPWQVLYYAMQLAYTSLDVNTMSQAVFAGVSRALEHNHQWIKLASSRLLGKAFAEGKKKCVALSSENLGRVVPALCAQLASSVLNEALATQCVKNLVFIAKELVGRGLKIEGAETTAEDADESASETETETRGESNPVRWMLTRLSYQLRIAHMKRPSVFEASERQWTTGPMAVLQVFAAYVSAVPAEAVVPVLVQMLTPLQRITNDPNAQDAQMVELQGFATEVERHIQNKVGAPAFVKVYADLQQRQAEKQRERKQEQAIRAVADPQTEAQRKMKRAEQRTKHRKRKALMDQGSVKKRR